MSAFENKKRWICPSDRELALRAKLNSGWSVHTHDTFLKPPSAILETELHSIEGVLERAKAIDFLEKERIEKLVCRLENMKRNAVGDGKKSCFMCGARFGIFRNQPSNCADCQKAVCGKCRIDIRVTAQEICLLCKICSEIREVWKKSGGWFYGEVPVAVDCTKAINTGWEHKKQDIVRLQSFKPPGENYIDVSLYKNWATNSSPDLSCLDEESTIFKKNRKCRTHSDSSDEEIEMSRLSLPVPSSHLSTSCPSLSPEDVPPRAKQARRRRLSSSRNRVLRPARKVMEKIHARSRRQ